MTHTIRFDGRSSTPLGGATTTDYAWLFGDGSTGTGSTPSRTYAAAGTYTVKLTITDSTGKVGVISKSVTVPWLRMPDNSMIEDLRRRVQTDPASIVFAQLAEEYRRVGRYQDAVETCRRGLGIHPDYLSARITLGRALVQIDQLDDAGAEFQRGLQSAPQNLAAIRGLAQVHHRKGSLPEALACYRAARSLAPEYPEIERSILNLSETLAQTMDARARVPAGNTLAALEQWLVAIHVTRAQRNA